MVVDRRQCINDNILGKFIKLLAYDEIKIIVPEIIKTETFRHLEDEVETVGKKLKEALKVIKDLYGISTIHTDPLNLTGYKKNARKKLNDAFTLYAETEDEYKKDVLEIIIKSLIMMIFWKNGMKSIRRSIREKFWNVASRNRQQPVKQNEQGVALISGATPRIFEMVAGGKLSPYTFMLEILEKERYAKIAA